MNDFFLSLAQFDPDIEGLVVPLPNGDYRIYVNSIFSKEKQKEIYDHELRHILYNHHSQLDTPVTLLEEQANNTTLLKEEIQQAAICGISTPLLPKRKMNAWEVELTKERDWYTPTYEDMNVSDILAATLSNLGNMQKELEELVIERENKAV